MENDPIELTWTIGPVAARAVSVVYRWPDGRTHTRNVNAAETRAATEARVADVARGVVQKAAVGAISFDK